MERADLRGRDVVYQFVSGRCTAQDAYREIAELAAERLGGALASLILAAGTRRASTVAATDEQVVQIDDAQYAADRGPCLEALRTGDRVTVTDLHADPRWPEFAEAARSHGLRSSVSLPVAIGDRPIGALNLYARDVGAFASMNGTDPDVFARDTAIIAAHQEVTERARNLQAAMECRAQIEQAKGVIMASTGCDADRAFSLLREQSQRENRKLRDVAGELVERQRRTAD